MRKVIVLGAKGRFGRAATRAFADAGWGVVQAGRGVHGPGWIDVDATSVAETVDACAGADVIVNAVNPPYDHWTKTVPDVTQAVIAAAQAADATVMIPGNLYNYGCTLPPVLREDTAWVANTRKASIRICMEDAFRDSGVQTIVLRGGDFLEPARTGNWFDSYIAPKATQGKLIYPGPLDQVHSWAYLPDMARAFVGLADKRQSLARFEEFGFAGYALTGSALVAYVESALGRPMRVSPFPWFALRVMQLGSPMMREVLEMRYLWDRPHEVDGTKLASVLPDLHLTPVQDAIAACLVEKTDAYVSSEAHA